MLRQDGIILIGKPKKQFFYYYIMMPQRDTNTDDEVMDIPEDPEKCPECQTDTIRLSPNKSYEYCTQCGLITRASTEYVAGQLIDLPYGVIII